MDTELLNLIKKMQVLEGREVWGKFSPKDLLDYLKDHLMIQYGQDTTKYYHALNRMSKNGYLRKTKNKNLSYFSLTKKSLNLVK